MAEGLAYDKLAPFQGPSLLVYNDAVFTADDFLSISQIGESVKRTQEGKTGWVPWNMLPLMLVYAKWLTEGKVQALWTWICFNIQHGRCGQHCQRGSLVLL